MHYIPIVMGVLLIMVGVFVWPDTKPVESSLVKKEDTIKTGEMRIVEDSDGHIMIEKYHEYPGWWPHSSANSIEAAREIKANWDKVRNRPKTTTRVVE